MTRMAASGAVSIPVWNSGKSYDNNTDETFGLISMPPTTVPRMMDSTVSPSIQPLPLTNWSGGSNSVRMPYLAGEYIAAPMPTII